ncbi:glucose-6-phosphate isomerase [Sutterella sp.]|uniref:glucose-6-phosphate isomerase n=1 Tax=Sutterella sp. TaxID=1981025 RepID=UPI0026E02E5A|nr:glucose-6-phosphate isomerase [Sutterella sp.]MDO5531038.1 glucose-6-phosphate isomerase [Sutterella sp.]
MPKKEKNQNMQPSHIPFLRESAPERAVACACGIKLDISRQRLTGEDLDELIGFAEKKDLLGAHARMCAGETVNAAEGRAALHTSLRAFSAAAPKYDEVVAERNRLFAFTKAVREGRWRGCRGDRITDVINIGIGGSEMGPHAVWQALRTANPDLKLHFLASVDGVLLERILSVCKPRSTLVIVSSKSFTTRETQVNAAAVDQWLLEGGVVGGDRARHMVVVSSNTAAADAMCLPPENQFRIWDWVGGRFSVWSAIGLPVMLALGTEAFTEFLMGANEMDRHSLETPVGQNLPALLALLEYWNANRLGITSHCMLPYDERLRTLVPWLQQLEMESLGKTTGADGKHVEGFTGLQVWGHNGNEGQHSFYQWLRDGTGRTSIDLLWSEMPGHRYAEHYRVLLANARAQAEALVMRGPGNPFFNAVSTIVLDAVTPRRLGALMAMYEHKTTMLGHILGLNPFDQPGVELGKRLSRRAEGGADLQAILAEVALQ